MVGLLFKDSRGTKGIEIKGSGLVVCVAEKYRHLSFFEFIFFILEFSAVSGVYECVIV